jgi:hypothetical protein
VAAAFLGVRLPQIGEHDADDESGLKALAKGDEQRPEHCA